MLTTMETYLRAQQRKLHRFLLIPGVQSGGKLLCCAGGGFFLSAAGLTGSPQPLASALILAAPGFPSLAIAVGAALGYRLFWGSEGLAGLIWSAAALLLAAVERQSWKEEMPLLFPVLFGTVVSAVGLGLFLFRKSPGFPQFFLQVWIAPVSAWFFRRAVRHRDSVTDWICISIMTLALACITPIPGLNLGCIAAGILMLWASFPAAAMAGMALDLARVSGLPLAAVVCIGWFARMLPFEKRWMRCLVPPMAALTVMALWGKWELALLPGLSIGAVVGFLLPPRPDSIHRRGQTGIAQVRLELTAGVLSRTQQLLLEIRDPPLDEEALLQQVKTKVCSHCLHRQSCPEEARLSIIHLTKSADFTCRHHDELHRELELARQRLYLRKADHQRRKEYRSALIQQYQFLSGYLRQLSDQLPRRGRDIRAHYRLEVSARSRGKEQSNGDSCMAFPGSGCRYYVLLCDGMGTGLGASQEGDSAGEFLRQMLTAGFPPEHALRSINSILALGDRAGLVTVDLAEIRLDCGRIALYKWGAAPSYVIRKTGAEKIGTATPPPGIRIADARETVFRLSLRRGEVLILLSDGAEAGECLRRMDPENLLPPGELAQRILEECSCAGEDDATAAVIRLHPRRTPT